MRYIIIIAIVIFAFIIMTILKKANKLTNKKFKIYLTVLLLIAILPIDYLFMRFSTPEAYMKYYFLCTHPQLITYGRESCDIRTIDNTGEFSNVYIRKENGLYKMHYGWQSELIKTTNYGSDVVINIVKVKETEDYYLEVRFFSDAETLKVLLDNGTELQLEKNKKIYYGQMYIEDYKNDMYIYINEDKVSI